MWHPHERRTGAASSVRYARAIAASTKPDLLRRVSHRDSIEDRREWAAPSYQQTQRRGIGLIGDSVLSACRSGQPSRFPTVLEQLAVPHRRIVTDRSGTAVSRQPAAWLP